MEGKGFPNTIVSLLIHFFINFAVLFHASFRKDEETHTKSYGVSSDLFILSMRKSIFSGTQSPKSVARDRGQNWTIINTWLLEIQEHEP